MGGPAADPLSQPAPPWVGLSGASVPDRAATAAFQRSCLALDWLARDAGCSLGWDRSCEALADEDARDLASRSPACAVRICGNGKGPFR